MRVAVSVALLLIHHILKGKVSRQGSLESIFPVRLRERTQLDSSIDVNKLSLESCYQLIEKAFIVDQQYRDSLRRYSLGQARYDYFTHLYAINDPVNQAILLKIVKRHGWPCKVDKRDLSFKAWTIAWHAQANLERFSKFHPYLILAHKNRCINPYSFSDFEKKLNYMKGIQSR